MSGCRVPSGLGTTLGLVVGIVLLGRWDAGALGSLGAAGAGLLLARRRLRSRAAAPWLGLGAVLALALAAGGLRAPARDRPLPPPGRDLKLAGRVLAWEARPYGVAARIALRQVGAARYDDPLPARLLAPADWGETPRSGWIAFRGDFEPDRGATNPGAWVDRRARGTLRPGRGVRPLWGPGRPPRLFQWRENLARRAGELLPGFPGRFAGGVLLGRSGSLTLEERTRFRRTGASHLVAVSGLHVGLVASLVALGLGGAAPALRFGGMTGVVWIYAALAGWSPSAVRAALLISLHGAGGWLGRPRPGVAWLALALPWLLWTEPALLSSVSFLLSVGAVGGILFLLEIARPPSSGWGRAAGAAAVCVGAQWGTLPTALAQFGTLSPLALGPNLVAVPLTGLFLPAVLLALITADLPGAGPLLRDAALGLGAAVGEVLRRGAEHLPFTSGWSAPPVAALALFPGLLLLWFSLPEARRRSRGLRAAAAGAAAAAAALCFLPQRPLPGPWAAFLDVGQGDASVFRLSDGTVWIVDTGDDRGPGDAARNAVLPFLRRAHVREVEGLILTHRHRDHVGALAPLLEGVSVRHIYGAGHGPRTGTSGQVDSVLAARGNWLCLSAAGDTLHLGGGSLVTAVHPPRPEANDPLPEHRLNDSSLITRVTDGPLSLLFAGDAETGAEAQVLAAGRPVGARILQVGHHGSGTSSSEAFLRAVGPEWAVVSVGVGNRYGHPDSTTLERLGALGARVHRTDTGGALWLRIGAEGEWIVESHPPARTDAGDSLSAEKPIW